MTSLQVPSIVPLTCRRLRSRGWASSEKACPVFWNAFEKVVKSSRVNRKRTRPFGAPNLHPKGDFMKTFSNSSLLIRFVCSCVMLAVLYPCLSAPAYAQASPPTQTTSCPVGDAGTNPDRGKGDDIQCRVNNLLNSNQNLLNTMKSKASSCVGALCDSVMDHLNRAQKAADHGVRANARVKGSDYDDLNTFRKAKCTGKNSDCASGNGVVTGGDSDPGIGQDIADHLDEATDGMDKANKVLSGSESSASLAQPFNASPPSTFETLSVFQSAPGYSPELDSGWFGNLNSPAFRFGFLLADQAAQTATTLSTQICNQVLVLLGNGGNVSGPCVPLVLVARAVMATNQVVQFASNNKQGSYGWATYDRENQLNDNLGQVDRDVAAVGVAAGNTQVEITQLQAQVAALQVSMNALQAQLASTTYVLSQKSNVSTDMDKQIMELLLSPDGTRNLPASLLTCTGDSSTSRPCPPVAITCSTTTGLCSFNPH